MEYDQPDDDMFRWVHKLRAIAKRQKEEKEQKRIEMQQARDMKPEQPEQPKKPSAPAASSHKPTKTSRKIAPQTKLPESISQDQVEAVEDLTQALKAVCTRLSTTPEMYGDHKSATDIRNVLYETLMSLRDHIVMANNPVISGQIECIEELLDKADTKKKQ